jgi:hypothetical protein
MLSHPHTPCVMLCDARAPPEMLTPETRSLPPNVLTTHLWPTVVQHTATLARYATHALRPKGGGEPKWRERAREAFWANGCARSRRRVMRRFGEGHTTVAVREQVRRWVQHVAPRWSRALGRGTYGGCGVGEDGQGLLRTLHRQVRRLLARRAASPNPDGWLEHAPLHTATRRPQHGGRTPWRVPAALRVRWDETPRSLWLCSRDGAAGGSAAVSRGVTRWVCGSFLDRTERGCMVWSCRGGGGDTRWAPFCPPQAASGNGRRRRSTPTTPASCAPGCCWTP